MFDASLLGLTANHFSYQIQHTLPEKALSDLSVYSNNNVVFSEIGKISTTVGNQILNQIKVIPMYIVSYFEKFLYISTFSFQGIPLVVLIPSLVSSIYMFKKWWQSNRSLLILNTFFWSYLFIYMIRSSHQRYILPLIPFAIIFFIFQFISFEKDEKKYHSYFIWTLVLTSIAVIMTFIYQDWGDLKALFNIFSGAILLTMLFAIYFLKKHRKILVKFLMIAIIVASVFINVYALSTKNQIYKSNLWGINGEADKIAQLVEPEDTIFVDCKSGTISEFTYLINIYRKNNYLPVEWHWKLDKDRVERKLDTIEIVPNFYYTLDIEDMTLFKEEIINNNINKIVLLKSQVEGEKFPLEDYIDIFKKEKWLALEPITQLKNKEIYIFDVVQ